MLGQRPDALVEHVHHRALGRRRQTPGEVLDQHEGRAQVGLDMPVPGRTRRVVPLVALEHAGVVDQHADRPQRRLGRRQQARHFGLPRQVGAQRDGRAAAPADFGTRRLRLRLRRAGMAVHGDGEPGVGQAERDGTAKPPRRARHQCGTRDAPRDIEGDIGGDRGRRASLGRITHCRCAPPAWRR